MLKELKPHQLHAAEFLLARLRGEPQNPSLETLFQSSSSDTREGNGISDDTSGGGDNDDSDDNLDWLEGSKSSGKTTKDTTTKNSNPSAAKSETDKLYQGAILADEMVSNLCMLFVYLFIFQ